VFSDIQWKVSFSHSKKKYTIFFSGNRAGVSGHSLYSTSLVSCYYTYRGKMDNGTKVYDFVKDLGNFTFDEDAEGIPAIGTTPYTFKVQNNASELLTVVPGEALFFPIKVEDEVDNIVHTEYFVYVDKSLKINVKLGGTFTKNRSVIVLGSPHEKAMFVVGTKHKYRSIQYLFQVTLLPCPPGFYFKPLSKSCKCSAHEIEKKFAGIIDCNDNFTAIIKRGYWAGYGNSSGTQLMFTALCPFQFCALNNASVSEYSLPKSKEELNIFTCGTSRKGILCGHI